VLQSHAALKQHTSELEGALAEKESSIVEVSARTQRELDEMARLGESKEAKLHELQGNVNKEKGIAKDFKKQVCLWFIWNKIGCEYILFCEMKPSNSKEKYGCHFTVHVARSHGILSSFYIKCRSDI
jgi:hypothetical protein